MTEFVIIGVVLVMAGYLRLTHGRKVMPLLTEVSIDFSAAAFTLPAAALLASICGVVHFVRPAHQSVIWLAAVMALPTAVFWLSHRVHMELTASGRIASPRWSDYGWATLSATMSAITLFTSIAFVVQRQH